MFSFLSRSLPVCTLALCTGLLFSCCQTKTPGGKEPITDSSYSSSSYSSKSSRSASDGYISENSFASQTVDEPVYDAPPEPISEPAPVAESKLADVPPLKPVQAPKKPSKLSRPTLPEEKAGKARKNIVVTAAQGDKIVTADDDNVTIRGEGGIIMVSGRCVNLNVEGNKTEVYCDIAEKVLVSGDGNSLTLGTVGSGKVTGDNNNIVYESGFTGGVEPDFTSSGEGNMLNKRSM